MDEGKEKRIADAPRRPLLDKAVAGVVVLVLAVAFVLTGDLLGVGGIPTKDAEDASAPSRDEGSGPAPQPADEAVPNDLAPRQTGHSYHTAGVVVALDADDFTFMLEVEESTEDIARGAHVMADCAYAETSELMFSELAVGMRVAVRSVQAHAADGTIPVQRYEAVAGADGSPQRVDVAEAPLAKPASSAEVEQAFASAGCGFRVVGTVVSSPDPADGSFGLWVDGGAVVAAGETFEVRADELQAVIGDESMLVEGATDVTVGMSHFPEGGVLRARALVVGAA